MDENNNTKYPKQVRVVENFLTIEECDHLIQYFNSHEKSRTSEGDFWDNRTVWFNRYDMPETLSNKLYIQRQVEAEIYAECKLELDPGDGPHIVFWPEGHKMPPHIDYGPNNEFPHREIASLIYLNDDYDGGELILPTEKLKIKPCRGELVIFRGGPTPHGVSMVTNGVRYTCPAWFKIA